MRSPTITMAGISRAQPDGATARLFCSDTLVLSSPIYALPVGEMQSYLLDCGITVKSRNGLGTWVSTEIYLTRAEDRPDSGQLRVTYQLETLESQVLQSEAMVNSFGNDLGAFSFYMDVHSWTSHPAPGAPLHLHITIESVKLSTPYSFVTQEYASMIHRSLDGDPDERDTVFMLFKKSPDGSSPEESVGRVYASSKLLKAVCQYFMGRGSLSALCNRCVIYS